MGYSEACNTVQTWTEHFAYIGPAGGKTRFIVLSGNTKADRLAEAEAACQSREIVHKIGFRHRTNRKGGET